MAAKYRVRRHSNVVILQTSPSLVAPQSSIPRGALIDSGYAVTGGVSPRAQIAISALAQALEQDGMVAVARFVKMEDADPVVGILFPMKIDLAEGEVPKKLVFVQMPFEEDYAKYAFNSFRDDETSVEQKMAAEHVIDSMMLGEGEFVSSKIPNPAIRSLNRTLIQKVVRGAREVEGQREGGNGEGGDDGEGEGEEVVDCVGLGEIVLKPSEEFLEKAESSLKKFASMFDLEEIIEVGGKKKKRYWSEINEDDEGEGGSSDWMDGWKSTRR